MYSAVNSLVVMENFWRNPLYINVFQKLKEELEYIYLKPIQHEHSYRKLTFDNQITRFPTKFAYPVDTLFELVYTRLVSFLINNNNKMNK